MVSSCDVTIKPEMVEEFKLTMDLIGHISKKTTGNSIEWYLAATVHTKSNFAFPVVTGVTLITKTNKCVYTYLEKDDSILELMGWCS